MPGKLVIEGEAFERERCPMPVEHPQAACAIAPAAVPRPARSMLVVGIDEADARDFIGDATTADPRKLKIPDDLWPPSEAFEGVFCAAHAVPNGRRFDAIVVTAKAEEVGVRDAMSLTARVSTGGWLWVEPPSVSP